MEWTMRPTFQDICTGCIELGVEFAEIVVNGCGTEHTDALASTFLNLEPLCLDDHAEALHEEDTAEDGQKEFFMDDDGAHTDDAADGQ